MFSGHFYGLLKISYWQNNEQNQEGKGTIFVVFFDCLYFLGIYAAKILKFFCVNVIFEYFEGITEKN